MKLRIVVISEIRGASTVDQWVKKSAFNLPALGVRDRDFIPGSGRSLEEGMATHSSILAWRIPWTEELGGLQPIESKESDTTEATEHAGML